MQQGVYPAGLGAYPWGMDSLDWHSAKALLEWQVELGVTETIGDTPVNRYELAAQAPKIAKSVPAGPEAAQTPAKPHVLAAPTKIDGLQVAQSLAAGAQDVAGLHAALEGFEHCAFRRGARNMVFADGRPQANVMILGGAPDKAEDQSGTPFAGEAGGLLDKMLAAIGMTRANDVYLSTVLPWRPPQNRDPNGAEIAMLMPFVLRHIELTAPKFLVTMGPLALQAVTGRRGLTRHRGRWAQIAAPEGRDLSKIAVLPMAHPGQLLERPLAKREAWADLLTLKARLQEVR